MHRGKDAVIVGASLLALVCCFSSGCSRFRVGWTRSPHALPPTAQQATVAPPVSEDQADDDKDVLAAVEAFLDRTEDYRLSDGSQSSDKPSGVLAPVPNAADSKSSVASQAATDRETGMTRGDNGVVVANAQVALDQPDDQSAQAPDAPIVMSVSIRADRPEPVPADEPAPNRTANKPLGMEAPAPPFSVAALIKHLESQVGEAGDFDSEWRLRLVQLAFDREVPPRESSSALSTQARGILDAVIRVAKDARRVARNPVLVGDDALLRAQELVTTLADRADPVVSAVALCRKVVTFGVYDEIKPQSLVAGRAIQAIVYTEVGNFNSEPTGEGSYRTVLATRLEVLTASGRSVWEREEPEIVDVCRRRRSDFFIAQRITLPASLAADDYVLKVLVEDRLSGKANEATLAFTILGPPSVATRRP